MTKQRPFTLKGKNNVLLQFYCLLGITKELISKFIFEKIFSKKNYLI